MIGQKRKLVKPRPSTQAFSSRSHDLARNFVTSPNGIQRERLVSNAKSKMAPSDRRRVIKLFKIFAVNFAGIVSSVLFLHFREASRVTYFERCFFNHFSVEFLAWQLILSDLSRSAARCDIES